MWCFIKRRGSTMHSKLKTHASNTRLTHSWLSVWCHHKLHTLLPLTEKAKVQNTIGCRSLAELISNHNMEPGLYEPVSLFCLPQWPTPPQSSQHHVHCFRDTHPAIHSNIPTISSTYHHSNIPSISLQHNSFHSDAFANSLQQHQKPAGGKSDEIREDSKGCLPSPLNYDWGKGGTLSFSGGSDV